MIKKIVFALLPLVGLATAHLVQAQQAREVSRIGFLTNNSASTFAAGDAAFRQGLRELGRIEGKNIEINWRYAEGNSERLRQMLTELIRSEVKVIVTGGPSTTRLAMHSGTNIPIVMATDPDPVATISALTTSETGRCYC